MGKAKKKGQAGTAIHYMTRNRAMKKLQVTLKDFRRLCILKGIYPREPKNKKALAGTTAHKTYYLAKDVMFLAHEPLLGKFREFKTFMKKLRRAMAKKEPSMVNRLQLHKPVYTLDHLVKERYPTFIDALRELDDALCLVFLFAQIPKSCTIHSEIVEDCRRLCKEFMCYVARTHCLRKVFLSIKGIYYQVDLMGQKSTWMTPYVFSQQIPKEVDYKIMLTFLEFYRTLLGFVNHKLYTDANLHYPPRLDTQKDGYDMGLSTVILEPSLGGFDSVLPHPPTESQLNVQKQKSETRLQTLDAKLQSVEQNLPSSLVEDDPLSSDTPFLSRLSEGGESDPAFAEDDHNRGKDDPGRLFRGCVFFLNREVPRESLEFVIKSFGGEVTWDDMGGSGCMVKEDDPRITHHIVDRPLVPSRFQNSRDYVQPQYVYDCANSLQLLPTFKYAPGVILPPHLSPFVEQSDHDYDPLAPFSHEETTLPVELCKKTPLSSYKAPLDDAAAEVDHLRELEAEAAGLAFSEYPKENSLRIDQSIGTPKKQQTMEQQERQRLAEIMMKKKDKRLYQRIQYGQRKKAKEIEKLQKRRRQIDASKAINATKTPVDI